VTLVTFERFVFFTHTSSKHKPFPPHKGTVFFHVDDDWFITESWGEEQLGGASADAQSYWQGRFAACAFDECV